MCLAMLTVNERWQFALFGDGFCRLSVQFGSACPGAYRFGFNVHIGHRPLHPLIQSSALPLFLPLILVLVHYSLKSFDFHLPLVKIKFIKTNVNVHMKIVWWFLEWVIFKLRRMCLSIYQIIIEIKCKFKNSFETFGLENLPMGSSLRDMNCSCWFPSA